MWHSHGPWPVAGEWIPFSASFLPRVPSSSSHSRLSPVRPFPSTGRGRAHGQHTAWLPASRSATVPTGSALSRVSTATSMELLSGQRKGFHLVPILQTKKLRPREPEATQPSRDACHSRRTPPHGSTSPEPQSGPHGAPGASQPWAGGKLGGWEAGIQSNPPLGCF